MFNFKKNQKTVFSKLYRYYCAKLLKKIGVALFYFLIWVLMMAIQGVSLKNLFDNATTWQRKLGIFWLISFFQLFALMQMMQPLISYLVGRGLGWEELKQKEFFKMPKISREEDVKVLIFTPDVEREMVIWAKFAAAFTCFMAFNFILTLFGFFYFLFFTGFGVTSSCFFLLLNGVGLGLVNSLLMVPFLFYQQEGGSFWAYFLCIIFIIILLLCFYLLWRFILENPVIFMLASVPLAASAGYLFFSLYWKKYLKNDLD